MAPSMNRGATSNRLRQPKPVHYRGVEEEEPTNVRFHLLLMKKKGFDSCHARKKKSATDMTEVIVQLVHVTRVMPGDVMQVHRV